MPAQRFSPGIQRLVDRAERAQRSKRRPKGGNPAPAGGRYASRRRAMLRCRKALAAAHAAEHEARAGLIDAEEEHAPDYDHPAVRAAELRYTEAIAKEDRAVALCKRLGVLKK